MTFPLISSESAPGAYIDNLGEPGRGARIDVLDPSTGTVLTQILAATADDVGRAVTAAAGAADAWAAVPPAARGRLLARCGEAILASASELTELDVRDAGLPRSLARRDVETAARYFEYYAGLADKLQGETIPLGPDFLDYTIREPWGVCGIVLPFNFPVQLAARDIAPALAVGNTVVAKPAEHAPLAVIALAEVCADAGLPPGVLNLVVGSGDVGEALVGHPLVDHVTFTGSQRTGRRVMRACADLLKPSTIELGGKSPHILFEDGSIEAAVTSIVSTSFRSAGQACSAGTRLLVHRDLHDSAVAALSRAVADLRVGPADDDPDVGPLISAGQRAAVVDAIAASVADGARALTGGGIPSGLSAGFFVEPTVLDGVLPGAAAAQEEIFGPVVSVLAFSSEEEAVSLANDTEYGLVAGIWTRELSRAHRVARALKAGQVFINNYGVGGGVELPFGGYKRSGIGRVKGIAATAEYTQLKNVCVALT
jgi:aldehyde dehydrogenase (NAD+)